MKILSIIYFKRFAQDETTVLYSPEEVSNILTQSTSLIPIRAYVGSRDEVYVTAFVYGTNSCVIGEKPTDTRLFYVPANDITLVREACIDLDICL